MSFFKSLILVLGLLSFTTALWGQEEPKQKSPEEYAVMEAERLEKELNLNQHQLFYVDSILQHNFVGLSDEFEKMKAGGMQDSRSYMAVKDKWQDRTLKAFEAVMDEQQYIKYLKIIGKGKEYKKGKDGLYYKKAEKK